MRTSTASCITIGILFFATCSAKYSSNVTARNKTTPERIQGLLLKDIARDLSIELNSTTSEELGIPFIQQLYAKFKYTSVLQDADKKLIRIASQLELKLNQTFELLNQTRSFLEVYHRLKQRPYIPSAASPCDLQEMDLEEFEVSEMLSVDNSYEEQPVDINQVLKNMRAGNKVLKGLVKQQFFLSHEDVTEESGNIPLGSCQGACETFMWSTYMSRVQANPRNVMLLLDHGGSLSKQQFLTVKALAKQVISVLNDNDRVGLLALAEDTSRAFSQECVVPNLGRSQNAPSENDIVTLIPASARSKKSLYMFIDNLPKGNASTNHSLGFQEAFEMIKASNISANETVMLLYVSRGLLSSLTEAKVVLETILTQIDDADQQIIINTCAVIDETKPVMYETHFLRDIAEQNYSKYNIGFDYTPHKGIMLQVNSTRAVGLAAARFFNTLTPSPSYNMEYQLSTPQWDADNRQLFVTASIPCGTHGEIGILGVDLYMASLMEDVTYYSNYERYDHAFAVDMKGITLAHPLYPRPLAVRELPSFVSINKFEINLNDWLMKHKNGGFVTQHFANKMKKVYWKNVLNYYIVGIVVNYIKGEEIPKRPFKVSWFQDGTGNQLVHHRLDIIPSAKMCRHFNQLATLDAGTLYLSASCFQSPTAYLHTATSSVFSPLTVQKCMAFLKDNTRYLSNPGLREEIRDDVATLAHILEYLRTQHLQGSKGRYIVRRYVASPSGVLETFPGGMLTPGFEPTRRSWYLRAVEHRFKTILTPPYLDAGGAGYIVTIAYATEHAVVGIDVTFGYIFKLVLEHMPFCTEKKIKCFMMDDRGYLIYHPNLIDPNGHGPIEQKHIIHKEPQVGNDILYHSNFIKKVLCNSFADSTVQRYYWLNTTGNEIIMNAVHGEHNAKYQVSPIDGTNAFIGFVNISDEGVATFCPCSMINRLCLNCNRMEQKECECPCECPLGLDAESCNASNQTTGLKPNNPHCPVMPEQSLSTLPAMTNMHNMADELKACLPIACETLTAYQACLGVLGCEWCQVDVDGETPLAAPFCTSIQTCFNGILGSPTPYGDSLERALDSDDLLLGGSYSPIGPVIGSMLAVCLILIFSFICYRSYTSPSVDRFYLTSAQENQVRMSDLNISDDYHELDNHQDKLLQDSKKPEPISPYCVSTGYRRPPTAADSDHGYSTMTPHDESEHLSFAPHELEEDETSDAASINTSVSSRRHIRLMGRNKHKLSDFTSLPNRNCIIAPVTVHRNMEYAQ